MLTYRLKLFQSRCPVTFITTSGRSPRSSDRVTKVRRPVWHPSRSYLAWVVLWRVPARYLMTSMGVVIPAS